MQYGNDNEVSGEVLYTEIRIDILRNGRKIVDTRTKISLIKYNNLKVSNVSLLVDIITCVARLTLTPYDGDSQNLGESAVTMFDHFDLERKVYKCKLIANLKGDFYDPIRRYTNIVKDFFKPCKNTWNFDVFVSRNKCVRACFQMEKMESDSDRVDKCIYAYDFVNDDLGVFYKIKHENDPRNRFSENLVDLSLERKWNDSTFTARYR